QVVNGINVGDAVISSGGYGLPDNTKIKIEPAGGSNGESADKDKDDKNDKAGGSAKPDEKDKN
ncbi:MAG: hypothetical protein WBD19_19095, partial [Candidatus Acidiferrum sp.]